MQQAYKDIIKKVQRPSRYLGNEVNSIHKSPLTPPFETSPSPPSKGGDTGFDTSPSPHSEGGDTGEVKGGEGGIIKIALIFPDLYEIGMSHLGLKILYHIINQREDAVAERVFSPDTDYEDLLLKNNLPLASLESSLPLNKFDIVGFTLQYELSFTNILNILKLGGIPLRQAERSHAEHGNEHVPLVIGGGPCAFNPEPLSDFFDLFVIGDGEEVIHELIDKYRLLKKSRINRKELLINLSDIEGVYVPSLFSVSYKNEGGIEFGNGSIEKVAGFKEGYNSVTKRTIYNLDSSPYPSCQIVPFASLIHDRVSVEIDRGCTHGCRFCQAGIIYRPLRERTPQRVTELLQETLKNTGYEEISLGSLSSGDYRGITQLVESLMNKYEQERTSISLPSLRPDTLNPGMLKEISRVRKTGFTIAVEAGTQRMRDMINKKIREEDIFSAVNIIASSGWDSLKLYFMIGLPQETDDDIEGIYNLCLQILKREKRIKNINVSVSSFVPKSHTPFQWAGQENTEGLKKKLSSLRKRFANHKRITLKWHNVEMSFLEGVFARGDRKLGRVIERAFETGCKFDGWTERIDFKKWMDAFRECGVSPEFYANREIKRDEILPWEHIKTGVSRKFLYKEFEMAIGNHHSPDCRYEGCIGCGLDQTRCKIQDARFKIQNTRPETCNLQLATPARSPVHRRFRIRYEKRGDLRFLSHLEVGRVFSRAFRRAGIPLLYSEGYHPHPRIAFGFALPVGIESSCEYLDAEIGGYMEAEEFVAQLNTKLPVGLKAISAEPVPSGARSISDITDKIIFSVSLQLPFKGITGQASTFSLQQMEEKFKSFFLQNSVIIDRVRKDGVRKVDIRPLVASIKVTEYREDRLKIEMGLKVLNGSLLQPVEVLQSLLSPDAAKAVLLIEKTGVIFS